MSFLWHNLVANMFGETNQNGKKSPNMLNAVHFEQRE